MGFLFDCSNSSQIQHTTCHARPVEPGVYRTSLRSKGDVNVARVAEKFGGGGHRNAAGCTLKGDLEEVEREIIGLLQGAVERANGLKDITEDVLQ